MRKHILPGIVFIIIILANTQSLIAQIRTPGSYSGSQLLNYSRTWTATAPIQNTDTLKARPLSDVKQVTLYIDGLGRPIETVVKQGSPLMHDLVVPSIYDSFSRPQYRYLPFVADSVQAGDVINDGGFKLDPFQQDSAFNKSQYPGETYYYGQTSYESSPSNRVQQTFAPGNSWMGSKGGGGEKAIKHQYLVNTVSDSVRVWTAALAIGSIPTSSGLYGAGQLYKTVVTDEAGHQLIQYVDMVGQIILTKRQLASTPGTAHVGWLCTYYVYDSLEHLRSVIQPRAVELILGSWTISQNVANELCFRYEYDARGRLIVKKTPGSGEAWAVYDARDRVVMVQDSALRVQGKWSVIVYDGMNRAWQSGLLTDANNRAYHQNLAYNSISYPNTSSNFELLTQQYYDDYSWVAGTGASIGSVMDVSRTSNSVDFITSYNVSPIYAQQVVQSKQARGMRTGAKVKVIGSTSTYLYSVVFFDDHQRPIQTQTINVSAGKDITTVQYDFSGKPLRTFTQHQKSGTNAQNHSLLTKMEYDGFGRPKRLWKNIDSAATDQLIDSIRYNELGQVQVKYLGTGLDSMTYDYNIRGWLTGINKNYVAGGAANYFGMELAYDKTTSVTGTTYSTALYNGDITGTIWKTKGDTTKRKYDFNYDNVDRLTSASFLQNAGGGWNNTTVDYTVSGISYDANGNIMTMSQRGYKIGGSAIIDSLTYAYLNSNASNRLQVVNDVENDTSSTLGDFHYKGTKQSSDYTYDGNGAATSDNNRGINSITYNFMGLTQLINVNTKGTIQYVYDASGNRLQKITVDSTTSPVKTITTSYIGSFVYQQDTLQLVLHEEGRIRWAYHKYLNGTTAYKFEYDYFEQDHQGNTRIVLTQQKDTAQYMATMEAAYRSTENALFYNIPASCYAKTSVSGYPTDNTTSPNDSLARVNGSGQKIGPAIILRVMAGDVVDIGCKSYYTTQTGTGTNSSFNDVLNSLGNGFQGVTAGVKGTTAQLTAVGAPLYTALTSFMTANNPTVAGKPRAYLNWMLMDNQLKYDSTYPQSGAVPVSNFTAGTLGTPGYTGIPITKSGYLYIYVNNETAGWDVFFDNLSIKVYSGPLVEETHYYPYGLAMANISSKALKTNYIENKYKYDQGAELQTKEFSDGAGLEMYETSFRGYDQQIGRFHQVDPLADQNTGFSTYSYTGGNPLLFNDPMGTNKVKYGEMTGMANGTTGGGGGPDGTMLGGEGDVGENNFDGLMNKAETAAQTASQNAVQNYQNTVEGQANAPGAGTSTLTGLLNNILNGMPDNGVANLTNNGDGTFTYKNYGVVNEVNYTTDKNGNFGIGFTFNSGLNDGYSQDFLHQTRNTEVTAYTFIGQSVPGGNGYQGMMGSPFALMPFGPTPMPKGNPLNWIPYDIFGKWNAVAGTATYVMTLVKTTVSVGRILSVYGFWLGVAWDFYGWRQHKISGLHFGVNTAMGIWGLNSEIGAPIAVGYFLFDSFYPGGIHAVVHPKVPEPAPYGFDPSWPDN